jgi:predicted dehydrogenase
MSTPSTIHCRTVYRPVDTGGPCGRKNVLFEMPFTANADEAREIAELAKDSDRVVMEAFNYRYHSMTMMAEQIILG